MRITGGQAKGIPIKAPKGIRTRPTSDKVRKALFDTLGARVPHTKVLDLFAGSGALGIEALSRGAGFAVFVETDPTAMRAISDNLARARLSGKDKIIKADFRSAVRRLEGEGEKFDLVFVDPPYESCLLEEATNILEKHRVISREAVIVVEHFKKTVPPPSISGIPFLHARNYGQTTLSYFQRGK